MMGAVAGPGDPQRARRAAEELAGRGVVGVALTYVDNTGICRVKTVPVHRLADAVTAGVGMAPVFDVFLVDDSLTTSAHIGGPVGDLRLYPDLDVLTPLAGQPGGAWAPADRVVLVKETIRAVSAAHGLRVSFAPVVMAGQVGNGGHLHCSAWAEGRNLFTGGDGPYGLTGRGESILAGLLDALPALCAVGAPSAASYLRLAPQRWAAPWQCWGRENREAALRLVTGTAGTEATAANAEIKCFDASANPYLVVGAVAALAAATADEGRRLPDEVAVDPATLPSGGRPPCLPRTIVEAVDHLTQDKRLWAALGDPLFEAFVAVRRA